MKKIWLVSDYDSHIVLLRSALLSKRLQAGEKMKTERFSLKALIEEIRGFLLLWLIALIPVLYILSWVWVGVSLIFFPDFSFFHRCYSEPFHIKVVHFIIDLVGACAFLYIFVIHWIIGVIGKIVEIIFGIIVLSCIVLGIPVFCYLKIKDYLNKCHQSNFTKGDKK